MSARAGARIRRQRDEIGARGRLLVDLTHRRAESVAQLLTRTRGADLSLAATVEADGS